MENLTAVLLTPTAWAEGSELSAEELDCVTAVVLKVLDRKCKMPADEQEAMLAIYDLLHPTPAILFDEGVHSTIDSALQRSEIPPSLQQEIHRLRLEAEARIPKPVMKRFKAKLRQELFQPET